MTEVKCVSYGKWRSPLTSDLIVSATIGLSSPRFDGEDIYWLESRPLEGGRSVIVKYSPNGEHQDITPAPFNVRSRVHEYGGGAFLVQDSTVYFCNNSDQRVYIQKVGESPQPLTPESKLRYADFCLDKSHNRLICVCEDHSEENHEPQNKLVTINITTGEVKTLCEGADFYASPRISPNNSQLAWLSWNHPNMPWDSTELHLADINPDGSLTNITLVAGGENESICQPEFSPNGILYFSGDRSLWWNLYYRDEKGNIHSAYPLDAEFGYPHWVFGESVYGFEKEDKIICTYTQDGCWFLGSIDKKTKSLTDYEIPFTNIAYLQVQGEEILFAGSSP
ncbi:MAG: S9 family peptidase, partial [Cyanobacteria bacterium J149]